MRRIALCLVAVAALVGSARGADEPEARARPFGLRDTTRARFAIEETRRLLEAGEVDRALAQAQEGIERHADDLYLEEQTPASERWIPVGQVLEALIEGLPQAARARYDSLAEPAVTPLFEQALERGLGAPLEEVRRRFGASRFGLEATRLLLDQAMEGGDLRRAALLAAEVTRRAPEDPAGWWRRMECLGLLGDGAGLAALAPPAGLVLETGRGRVDVTARLEELRQGLPSAPPRDGWPMWGGQPDLLGTAARGASGPGLRWSVDLALSPREQDLPGRDAEGDDQVDFVAHLDSYRPVFPAADARAVYVSDGRGLAAIDLFGGRVLWRLTDPQPGLPLLGPRQLARGRSALDRPFAPTLWRDRVIATLEVQREWREDRVLGTQVNFYMPRRVLVAVSRSDGRLLWRSGQRVQDRPRLARVHVCSEPVVLDDVVVVVGSRYDNYEQTALFGFDAASGALRWETPLAYGQQETNLFGNPVKEFSAGAVSGRDGMAYASTGLGCLAAVRVADGRLAWLASYEVIPIEPVQMWFQPRIRVPFVGPTAPLVTQDLVVVAPGDGRHVSAYTRAGGRLAWRVGHEDALRASYRTLRQVVGVAPVGGRDAVIVTGGNVLALDLAHGRLLARGRFDGEESRVRGQGLIRGREVLVPTEEGLQRFSLDGELKLLGREPWSEDAEPGNLVAVGSVLVVAARSSVQAHYAWPEVERDLARRRRERPQDPEVLLEAGDLYLRGRGPAEARAAFRAALELAPPGSAPAERARRGLFEAWMAEGRALAQGDPVRGAPAWREALALATLPKERVEARLALDAALVGRHEERVANLERLYEEAGEQQAELDGNDLGVPVRALALLRLARVEEDARRAPQAVAALQRLLEEHGTARIGIEDGAGLARRRIAALLERFGPQAYAAQEALARAGLAAAQQSQDAAALERVLATWPNASVVPAARLALGRARLEAGRAAEAATPLRALAFESPQAPEARTALLLLARAYAALGAVGAREAALDALAALPAEPPIEVDGRALAPAEAAAQERAGRAAPPPEGALTAPLVERLADPPADEEITLPLAIAVEQGTRAPLALTSRAGTLRCYDLTAGALAFELPDAQAVRAAYGAGTLALALRGELRGVDPTSGATRWRQEREVSLQDLAIGRGTLVALGQARGEQGLERVLEALDVATGLPLWRSDLGPEAVYAVTVAGGHVLVSRMRSEGRGQRTRLLVLDLVTGAPLGEVELPLARDLRETLLPGLALSAGQGDGGPGRRVTAIDLPSGTPRWTTPLASASGVSALVPTGDDLWVLQQDGTLSRLALANGAPLERTRIAPGASAHARPTFGSEALVADGRLVMLALDTKQGSPLLAFDLATGKVAWEVPAEPLGQTQQHMLEPAGDLLVALWAGAERGQGRRVLVRLVRASDGQVLQEIESTVGSQQGVASVAVGRGGVLIVSGGGAVLYAAPPPAAR